MGIPHKHSKLIKLWADGAKIQVWDTYTNTWACTNNPVWHLNYEYRIKPETIKYKTGLFKSSVGKYCPITIDSEGEFQYWNNNPGFVRWLTDWIEVVVD